MAEAKTRSSLDTVLAIWSRRKWLALLALSVPLAVGVSLTVFLPNLYRSTATVLVDRQQIPEAFVRSTVTGSPETRLQTISQEVLSRARLSGLIERFSLYRDLVTQGPVEAVIARMRSDIKLEIKSAEMRGQRETVAFTVSYQGSDPQTVSAVTNTLASFYIEENTKARERLATGTAEFLKVQLAETKRRLDEQELRVSAFKRRHLGELPQQMEQNLTTLDRLHQQLRQNADGQLRAKERQQALTSQLAESEALLSSPAFIQPGVGATVALVTPEARDAARLAQKKEELAKFRSQYTDKHPDVKALIAEVETIEREVAAAKARAPKSDPNPAAPPPPPAQAPLTPYVLRLKEALNEAQSDLRVLKSEEGRLKESIASYQSRVENVPRREQEFKELSRDYESTRDLYSSLLKRYEEAQLAGSMEQRQQGEQFRVLDPAIQSSQPAAPNRAKLLLITVVAGLGLAVGAVLLAEHVDTSFHSLDELRTFSNVPVLASIPKIVTRTDLRRRGWRMRLVGSVAVVGLVVVVALGYVAATGNERLVLLLAKVAS